MTFSGGASFGWVTFGGEAGFTRVIFHNGAGFDGSTFRVQALFAEATFGGEAGFTKVTFQGKATFTWARFHALAYFKNARFFDRLVLRHVLVKGSGDFRYTHICQLDAQNLESPAIIEGRLDFRMARIFETHIQDVTFEKDVTFSDALFGAHTPDGAHATPSGGAPAPTCAAQVSDGVTVFRFFTFEGNGDFLRARFTGPTSLERVTFRKEANFTGATVKGPRDMGKPTFAFSYITAAKLRTTWAHLPDPGSWLRNGEEPILSFADYEESTRDEADRSQGQAPPLEARQELEPLSEVFKYLEATFRSQDQLDDANAAYYAMKRAELREARASRSKSWEDFGWWVRCEIQWLFWGVLCGYGTKIW